MAILRQLRETVDYSAVFFAFQQCVSNSLPSLPFLLAASQDSDGPLIYFVLAAAETEFDNYFPTGSWRRDD
jgi:hypothetical protein